MPLSIFHALLQARFFFSLFFPWHVPIPFFLYSFLFHNLRTGTFPCPYSLFMRCAYFFSHYPLHVTMPLFLYSSLFATHALERSHLFPLFLFFTCHPRPGTFPWLFPFFMRCAYFPFAAHYLAVIMAFFLDHALGIQYMCSRFFLPTHALASTHHAPLLCSCTVHAVFSFSAHALAHSHATFLCACGVPTLFSLSIHTLARSHTPFSFSCAVHDHFLLSLPTPWHAPLPLFLVHVLCIDSLFPFLQLPTPWHVPLPHVFFHAHEVFFFATQALVHFHAPFLFSCAEPVVIFHCFSAHALVFLC